MKGIPAAIVCLLLFSSIALQSLAEDNAKPNQPTNPAKPGYIDCSNRKEREFVPLLLKPCTPVPVSNVRCGQKVNVFERQGDLFEVAKEDGVVHYIESSSVSQKGDSFVPFDAQSGIPDAGPANCPKHGITPPRAVFAPDPEYSDKAREAHIWGVVSLSLTVGIDGKPRDITVMKKLGYGLDEKAIEAARQWRFQPATRDGKPVEANIQIVMTFRSISSSH
jgi:TonB family protein